MKKNLIKILLLIFILQFAIFIERAEAVTWEQIFTILHKDPKLKQYDSDYLKDIAIEHGIRLVLGEHIFVHKKKAK